VDDLVDETELMSLRKKKRNQWKRKPNQTIMESESGEEAEANEVKRRVCDLNRKKANLRERRELNKKKTEWPKVEQSQPDDLFNWTGRGGQSIPR